MKKSFLIAIGVCLFIVVHAQEKANVLVLGSYHMGNPGMDKFNMEADDVTSPRRQKEIEEFVTLLAKFKPTKICLEAKLENQKKLNDQYQSYLAGTAVLTKNEIDQVGFRLAKKMNLKEVYAIDAPAPFDMDTVIKAAERYQNSQFLKLMAELPNFVKAEDKRLRESTITGFYEHLNSDSYNAFAHRMYLEMAAIGKENNYVGADLVADWYKRNLRIYRNLQAIPFKSDDRILILYGAGHSKILQDLVEDSANLKLVKLNEVK